MLSKWHIKDEVKVLSRREVGERQEAKDAVVMSVFFDNQYEVCVVSCAGKGARGLPENLLEARDILFNK